MKYEVRFTPAAIEDLRRLEDFLIEQALEHGDFDLPGRAMAALRNELKLLQRNPYTCRIADRNPLERELVIPWGASGFVALFEIVGAHELFVSAVRHQREDDYH